MACLLLISSIDEEPSILSCPLTTALLEREGNRVGWEKRRGEEEGRGREGEGGGGREREGEEREEGEGGGGEGGRGSCSSKTNKTDNEHNSFFSVSGPGTASCI